MRDLLDVFKPGLICSNDFFNNWGSILQHQSLGWDLWVRRHDALEGLAFASANIDNERPVFGPFHFRNPAEIVHSSHWQHLVERIHTLIEIDQTFRVLANDLPEGLVIVAPCEGMGIVVAQFRFCQAVLVKELGPLDPWNHGFIEPGTQTLVSSYREKEGVLHDLEEDTLRIAIDINL